MNRWARKGTTSSGSMRMLPVAATKSASIPGTIAATGTIQGPRPYSNTQSNSPTWSRNHAARKIILRGFESNREI